MDLAELADLEELAGELELDRSTLLKNAMRRGCRDLRFERACEIYRRGDITLSKAAQMARVSLREMLLRMPQAGLELNYAAEDLREDLAS